MKRCLAQRPRWLDRAALVPLQPVRPLEELVDGPAFKAELFDRDLQAISGEMEGVGLAAPAVRHGVPWILVKAIGDWADGQEVGA